MSAGVRGVVASVLRDCSDFSLPGCAAVIGCGAFVLAGVVDALTLLVLADVGVLGARGTGEDVMGGELASGDRARNEVELGLANCCAAVATASLYNFSNRWALAASAARASLSSSMAVSISPLLRCCTACV